MGVFRIKSVTVGKYLFVTSNNITVRLTSPLRTCTFSPPSTRTRSPTSSSSNLQGWTLFIFHSWRANTIFVFCAFFVIAISIVSFFARCWCFVLIMPVPQSYPLFNHQNFVSLFASFIVYFFVCMFAVSIVSIVCWCFVLLLNNGGPPIISYFQLLDHICWKIVRETFFGDALYIYCFYCYCLLYL